MNLQETRTRHLRILAWALAGLLLAGVAGAATSREEQHACNGGNRGENGDGAPDLPPLQVPFRFGDDWLVGDVGSFFGDGWHCNDHNDYYATDWNLSGSDDEGEPVFPVAAGVVRESYCNLNSGYGCRVVIEHRLGADEERFQSLYAHLGEDSLDHLGAGDVVMPWTQIGTVGDTSNNNIGAHLHLGLKSYHNGGWHSKCDDDSDGDGLCLSGEDTDQPQSRKPRWMWEAAANDTIMRGGVDDEATLTSGNRPRIFVPGILNATNWDTNLYVRNNHSGANQVEVRIYDRDGSHEYSNSNTLAADGSWRVTFSTTIRGGTAVVLAEAGKDISVVARVQRKNSTLEDAYAAFEGIEQPMTRQSVPLVHRSNYGWYNRIFLFNPDAETSVDATIDFGDCNDTFEIQPMETHDFNTYYESCLPSGWYGSATVSARIDDGSGSPAVLAVTSVQERRLGGQRRSMAVAAVSREVGDSLYVPLINNNNYGYRAGISAERNDVGLADLEMTYREQDGDDCLTDTWSSWPVIVTPIPSSPDGCATVLAAEISTPGADYVSAHFSQSQGNDSSAYPAVANPTRYAYIPFLDGGSGVLRGIQIQNTVAGVATGTIRFYNDAGSQVGSRPLSIPAQGFVTLVGSGQIPSSARNARIEMDEGDRVAVLVNNVMPDASDTVMDYIAPGRF